MKKLSNQKRVVVSAIAADSSGAKMILLQFIREVAIKSPRSLFFTFFVPSKLQKELELFQCENLSFVFFKETKGFHRVLYDLHFFHKMVKTLKLKPNLLISLQNTFPFLTKRYKRLNYIHQPNPFTSERLGIKKAIFYKLLYLILIKITSSKQTSIIVQTDWMKKRIAVKRIKNKIVKVFRPSCHLQMPQFQPPKKEKGSFIYPATDFKYKNHKIIIDSLGLLAKEAPKQTLSITFTLSKNSWVYDYAKKQGVLRFLNFEGLTAPDRLLEILLKSEALLFPSKIESFGLPLAEAQHLNLKIIASEIESSKDVCKGYQNITYLDPNNPHEWKRELLKSHRSEKQKCFDTKSLNLPNGDWYNVSTFIQEILEDG